MDGHQRCLESHPFLAQACRFAPDMQVSHPVGQNEHVPLASRDLIYGC